MEEFESEGSREGPQLHIRLDPDLKRSLRLLAKRNRRNMAAEAAIAIEEHIKRSN